MSVGACEINEGGFQVVTGGAGRLDPRSDAATDVPTTSTDDAAAGDGVPIDAWPSLDTADDGADFGDGGSPVVDAWPVETAAGDELGSPVCQHCTGYGAPRALGLIPQVIHELSGLAASRRHPGILYAHNDSGDTARFFALDQTAKLNAEIDLPGASATDWEDIAMGPCAVGSCVYLGDIGDNNVDRTQYIIYRVAEPDTLPSEGGSINVTYERFPFVYPDGPHNAESLLVHPQTGRVFVVLKESGVSAGVYEMPLPLQADNVVTVVKVGSLSVPATAGLVTAGSFHPCGDRMLIRTKKALYELTGPPGGDPVSVFGGSYMTVPVAVEQQGEAAEYAPDGLSYYTSSETVNGVIPALSLVECQ